VAGSCEHGEETSVSGATELVCYLVICLHRCSIQSPKTRALLALANSNSVTVRIKRLHRLRFPTHALIYFFWICLLKKRVETFHF
jgi:hypothetical protein